MLLYTTKMLTSVNKITIAQITLSPFVRLRNFPLTVSKEENSVADICCVSLITSPSAPLLQRGRSGFYYFFKYCFLHFIIRSLISNLTLNPSPFGEGDRTLTIYQNLVFTFHHSFFYQHWYYSSFTAFLNCLPLSS